MNNGLLFRAVAISVHIFLNFILVSYLMRYDLTGSWVNFTLFIVFMLILLALFVKHLLSFIMFIKSKS
jgi:hypothetical protein